MRPAEHLLDGDIELEGRIITASNATFRGHIGTEKVVYKPIAGERPLWDFPTGNLAQREVASYELSECLGWDIVPRTWMCEGPFGAGMAQLWRDPDPEQDAVTLMPADEDPGEGWCHVFDGIDEHDRPVSLLHEDSAALRRMAVFDLIANNADRKGGHVLEMDGGHRYGVDHGLTFHVEHKLRTVLWGWMGHDLSAEEIAGITQVRRSIDEQFGEVLAELISSDEVEALAARCDLLLETRQFPAPLEHMPAIPWPPF